MNETHPVHIIGSTPAIVQHEIQVLVMNYHLESCEILLLCNYETCMMVHVGRMTVFKLLLLGTQNISYPCGQRKKQQPTCTFFIDDIESGFVVLGEKILTKVGDICCSS